MKDFGSHFLMNGITVFKLMCKRRPAVLSFHHPKKSKNLHLGGREKPQVLQKKTLRGLPSKASENKEKEWWKQNSFAIIYIPDVFFSGTKIPVHHLGPAKIRFFGGGSLHKKEGQVRYPLQAPRLL